MRTIIWFFYFWTSLIVLSPRMLLFKKGWLKKDPHALASIRHQVRSWAQQMLFLAGVSTDVEGLENIPPGPVVFACNHQGNFDIPVVLTCLGQVYPILAKAELERLPFIRTWMKYIGCLFLDRNDARKAAVVSKEAMSMLSQGQSLIIFPEGTRSKSTHMGPFREGAFRITTKTGVPIVPVCLEGSYNAMEAHGFWIHPALVHVRILPPIPTKGLSREESKGLSEIVARQIQEAKDAL